MALPKFFFSIEKSYRRPETGVTCRWSARLSATITGQHWAVSGLLPGCGVLSFKLQIYDLEDVKNYNSETNELFVLTIDKDLRTPSLAVDETEIFLGDFHNVMQRLDFGSFEYFRNVAKSATLSWPWRRVWWSKGVDEEPLEPVHRIEVYKEVVKLFPPTRNELSSSDRDVSDSWR